MNYLLDTCLISELVKTKPDSRVTRWIRSQDEEGLFLNVITIGEIQKGISKLPDGRKKKQQLQNWLNEELQERFKDRILEITIFLNFQISTLRIRRPHAHVPLAYSNPIGRTGKNEDFY